METETFDPFDDARIVDVQLELIRQLSPADRARFDRAEPGSMRLHPPPFNGWWRVTAGIQDCVDLGDFHVSALEREQRSAN